MTASELIDKRVVELNDWRGQLMIRIRKLIHEVDSEIVEEWKWDTPVFTHKGMVCALGAFKDHVRINFFKGASLADPKKLFNAGLEAKTSRGINLFEGDEIDEMVLKDLIRAAVDYNVT